MNAQASRRAAPYVWIAVLVLVPCVLILVAWILIWPGCPPDSHGLEKMAQEARKLQSEGKREEALKKWEELRDRINQLPGGPNEVEAELLEEAERNIKLLKANGVEKMAQEARKLQSEGKREEALKKWEELRDRINQLPGGPNEAGAKLLEEAERNIELLKRPHDPAPEGKPVAVPEPENKPAKVPDKTLESYYPVGRKIRRVGYLCVEGTGSNQRWFVETDARFLYNYRVTAETTVIENTGTVIVFEQRFPEVVQERAVWDSTVSLRPLPPLVDELFDVFERGVLKRLPGYSRVRRAIDIWLVADPEGKRLLTALRDRLREGGFIEDEKLELAVQVEKLQGTTLRLRYVSGLGVTEIKIEEGRDDVFSKADLQRIAYGSSLLMDYFICPNIENRKTGDRWEVRASDVAALLNVYEAELDGTLSLKLTDAGGPEKDATLEIVGGEVIAQGDVGGKWQSTTVRPVSGNVQYSRKDLLIRKATAELKIDTLFATTNHLLFGTKRVADLRIMAVYEARSVSQDDGATAARHDPGTSEKQGR